jgi:hypothetical protein
MLKTYWGNADRKNFVSRIKGKDRQSKRPLIKLGPKHSKANLLQRKGQPGQRQHGVRQKPDATVREDLPPPLQLPWGKIRQTLKPSCQQLSQKV